MARSDWVDIQFQRADKDDVRLEKLRRLATGLADLARSVQLLDAGLQLTDDATGTTTLVGGTAQLAVTIANNAVTNAKLADMAADTLKGRLTTPGDPMDLTAAQVAGLINTSLDHNTLANLTTGDPHTQYVLRGILTTNGDIFQQQGGVVDRLGIGTPAQVMRVLAGQPAWQTISPVLTLGTDLSGNATLTDLGNATLNATVVNDAITNAKLRDSAALSVIGRSANTIGDPADIVGADGQILRVSGTTLGFGFILSNSVSDFSEAAQDAIGAILTDTASVDLVYNDGAGTITATVLPAGIDHGGLAGLADDDHPQYAATAQNEAITGAWNFTTRQQVFGATTANIALVSGLADTGASLHNVEQLRIHRIAAEPTAILLRVNGSYAAPTTLVSGNSAGSLSFGGYDGTTVQNQSAMIFYDITETWSGAARGGNLRTQTTTTGTTTRVDRLTLGGNATGGFALLPDGVLAQPGQSWISDTNTGRYRIGADNMGDACNAVLQVEYGATYSDQKTQARWTGVNSPAQLVANTNDWTGAAGNFTVVRFSTDAARNITGLTGGVAGRFALCINIGTQTGAFTNNDAASAAGNRLLNASGGTKTCQPGGSILYWFDGTSAAWRQVAAIA